MMGYASGLNLLKFDNLMNGANMPHRLVRRALFDFFDNQV